jgi:hypothetical protein
MRGEPQATALKEKGTRQVRNCSLVGGALLRRQRRVPVQSKRINPPTARQSREEAEELAFQVANMIRQEKGLEQKKSFPSACTGRLAAGVRGGTPVVCPSVGETPHTADPGWRSTGGAMTGAAQPALEMLDALASVGAQRFDITFTDAAGEKVGFCRSRPLDQFRPALPAILKEAAER